MAIRASGADGGGDFAGFRGGGEFFHEREGEVLGGACAAGGDEVAINDDALIGEDGGEFAGDGKVGGVAAGGEEAGVVKDGRRGADGGDPATGSRLGTDERGDAGIRAQVFHARATRKKEEIENAIRCDGGEGRVGVDGEAAAAGDVHGFAERGGGDFDVGAAEEIERGDGFNLFKTLWQNGENGGHGLCLFNDEHECTG